jgi:hypothetical protein
MYYEKYDTWWTGTERTQTNPNEPKFKIGKMNASSIVTKDYENICPCGVPKNEPNSKPIKLVPSLPLRGAVERVEGTQSQNRQNRQDKRNVFMKKNYRIQPFWAINTTSKQLTHQFARSRIALTQVRLSEIIIVSVLNRFFGVDLWKGRNCEKSSTAVQK